MDKTIHKIQVDGAEALLPASVEDISHPLCLSIISVIISQKGTIRALQSERDSAKDVRMFAKDCYLVLVNRIKRRFYTTLKSLLSF